METETPVIEGQVPETVTEKLTDAEIVRRIETDNDFANAYLSGKVKIDPVEETAAPAAAAPEAPAPEAVAPAPLTPEPPKVNEDGKFIVELPGGKQLEYKTKGEALKAIREREIYIEKLENLQRDRDALISELRAKVGTAAPTASPEITPAAVPAAPKSSFKFDESVNLYDEENLRKIAQEVVNLREELNRRDELDRQRETTRTEQERKRSELAEHFRESNALAATVPELHTGKPIEQVNEEYKQFLVRMGRIAGTDGSMKANLDMMDVYLDGNSEPSKKLRTALEEHGIRPPQDYDKLVVISNLMEERKGLFHLDRVTGKQVPFTLEETYRYLKTIESPIVAGINPVPAQAPTPAPTPTPVSNPISQARKVAEEHAKNVAADLPATSGSAPLDITNLTDEQKAILLDTPTRELKANPDKLRLVNSILKSMGQDPIRIDGVHNH